MTAKRGSTITSHVGLSRFLASVKPSGLEIPSTAIPRDAYSYSQCKTVYKTRDGELVTWTETSHKHYELWWLSADECHKRNPKH